MSMAPARDATTIRRWDGLCHALHPALEANKMHKLGQNFTAFGGSDKNLGLQKKRETPTVKANESLLNHRRRPLSCKYKYRSPSRLGQAQAYPRWNNVSKKQVNRRCERH